jgi:hypothetical protein
MLVLLAASACQAFGGTSSTPSPSPTPTPSQATRTSPAVAWIQDLKFSGAFDGAITAIVPNQPGQRSECTGKNSRSSGAWGSTIYGQIGASTYAVVIKVSAYRGPGNYTDAMGASVQVRTVDDQKIYATQPGDAVSFVVTSDEESGTVRGVLSNVQNLKDKKLLVDGQWSCKT